MGEEVCECASSRSMAQSGVCRVMLEICGSACWDSGERRSRSESVSESDERAGVREGGFARLRVRAEKRLVWTVVGEVRKGRVRGF